MNSVGNFYLSCLEKKKERNALLHQLFLKFLLIQSSHYARVAYLRVASSDTLIKSLSRGANMVFT